MSSAGPRLQRRRSGPTRLSAVGQRRQAPSKTLDTGVVDGADIRAAATAVIASTMSSLPGGRDHLDRLARAIDDDNNAEPSRQSR